MSADDLVTDRAGVARIFAVTLNHVNKLRARGMPRLAHGQYSIPAVVQWRLEQLTNRAALDADEMPQAVEARTRLINAQEIHKRIEIRRLESELLPADEVRTNILGLCQVLVTALEGLPSRAAQDLASAATTAEAVQLLREHCHDARVELESRIAGMAGDMVAGGADDETTADQERGAMG
tara:strand:- start:5708 stop:6247 length:540 start_codon:yes stop_codon:yes gene_type:complete